MSWFRPGLSRQQLEKAVARLREGYDGLIVEYEKPVSLKHAFEQRLLEADRRRLDLPGVLALEIKVLEDLKAQARSEGRPRDRESNPAPPVQTPRSYADRVLDKLNRRIEKYPDWPLHDQAPLELTRLLGTLAWLKRTLWPSLAPLLRRQNPPFETRLEIQSAEVCPEDGRLPKETDLLRDLFEARAPLAQVSRQQRRVLSQAARWLGGLQEALVSLDPKALSPGERRFCEQSQSFLSKTLDDFRLRALVEGGTETG